MTPELPTPKTAHMARLWLVALLVGLIFESVALAAFSPATFMLFAVVGVPLCLAAAAYFGFLAVRALIRGGLL